MYRIALFTICLLASASFAADPAKIRVAILDGQNNHNWQQNTPILKKHLESANRFDVQVITAPARGKKDEMAAFKPDFSKVDVLVSNYNGESWSKAVNDDLDARVKSGKLALVIVHAANNAFTGWKEYNLMIGMGWRDAKFGKRLKYEGDKPVMMDAGQDQGAGHRYTGPFTVTLRDTEHPVTKGMPKEWLHARDELYDNMRGPIENVKMLATAYSSGTKTHEPMIWTVSYGEGRIFHTPMGHDANAMRCVGFGSVLNRGTEWAATGKVTIPLPADFPTAEKVSQIAEK